MRKSIKQRWIEAYETTLREYKENRHYIITTNCTKCILVDIICIHCPENVFSSSSYYGCIKRDNTKADDSKYLSTQHRTKVIKYHKRAIEYLKSIKRFNLKTFSNKLVKIDRDINK